MNRIFSSSNDVSGVLYTQQLKWEKIRVYPAREMFKQELSYILFLKSYILVLFGTKMSGFTHQK